MSNPAKSSVFDPVVASNNIKDEFVDYISTKFSFADKDLRRKFEKELNKEISQGPFLEMNDVFESGKSMDQLIDEGVLSPLFRDLESQKPIEKKYKRILPLDRPLYKHQEQAIRCIVKGDNAVISTGTGSGKTNCFLIPVINELLREKENGTLCPGIRAMFIYPMNALANDQIKNLRRLLMMYPDITFGVYNGATEEDERKAINSYKAMYANETIKELREPLPNELLSREKMKETPPHILFTNYAMLEHLLFRPKDDVLFSNSEFKFVVLDEAHVYSGATGIETSILLRRLKARIKNANPQFILTSATLGSGEDADEDILKFAENLCDVKFKKENIIRKHSKPFIPSVGKVYSAELIKELADRSNNVHDVLSKYGVDDNNPDSPEEEALYDFVKSSDLYQKLRIDSKRTEKISAVKDRLCVDMDTTIAFISLCTRAQKDGKALVDLRYHYFVRSLEGCFITLAGDKKLFLNRRQDYFDEDTEENYKAFEIALCEDCGHYALVGRIDGGELKEAKQFDNDIKYLLPLDDVNVETEDESPDCDDDDSDETESKSTALNVDGNHYILCKKCGKIVEKTQFSRAMCDCGAENYIEVVEAQQQKSSIKCASCNSGKYGRFYLGNDAATSVLATALYEELPEYEYEEESSKTNRTTNPFLKNKPSNKKTGKHKISQFLTFSDSRQEAARFACYLEKYYHEFLRRRGICHIIKENKDWIMEEENNETPVTISAFVGKLKKNFENNRTFDKKFNSQDNLSEISKEEAWVAMINELARFNSSTSLTSLGILQFHYLGNTEDIVSTIASLYHVDEESVSNLLDLLIFEMVKSGCVGTDSNSDIGSEDREYIFYSKAQKYVSPTILPKARNTVFEWPAKNTGDNKYRMTNRLYYTKQVLHVDDEEAAKFLDDYFDYLISKEDNPYPLEDPTMNRLYVVPAKSFQVKIPESSNARWYRCKKCGRVSQFNLEGKCISVKCGGDVELVEDPSTLSRDNHYAKLYFSERTSPLLIKEHTAQLSKKNSLDYQEQFIKKEINALSCSTTFELGVDVGDLETVFLRDVPPLPSNYAQRAGRAGRSINSAAYCLTFAKLSSHDLTFFKEPEKMISGTIEPPLFKIDNEKIVRRHIYDVALSMFFSAHEDLYNGNNADLFLNQQGYTLFIDWLNTKPENLKEMLKKSIPDNDNLHARMGIDDYGWLDDFIGEEGVFTLLIKEYEKTSEEFDRLYNKYKRENDFVSALKCKKQKEVFTENRLIDFLARGNILPRYGFPVDTVELIQNSTNFNGAENLRLSRDMSIALGEYAPSSEVIADGRMYTSRYIKKRQIQKDHNDWDVAYIAECRNCQTKNYSRTPVADGEEVKCISCGEPLRKRDFRIQSIEPRAGFVTEEKSQDVPMRRQQKHYRTGAFYIGNDKSKTIDKFKFKFNGVGVTMESTTDDSLLVMSDDCFYVCPKCGFAYARDEVANLAGKGNAKRKIEAKPHKNMYGVSCDSQEMKQYYLHHCFNTDVAKITFDSPYSSNYQTMLSVMYAILYAVSDVDVLNIDRKDINACLALNITDKGIRYAIIIYDDVPGGAGHSRRLVTENGRVFKKVIEAAYKRCHCCNCDPSCYNCLRSYENQNFHDILDRKQASSFLNKLRGPIEIVETEEEPEAENE